MNNIEYKVKIKEGAQIEIEGVTYEVVRRAGYDCEVCDLDIDKCGYLCNNILEKGTVLDRKSRSFQMSHYTNGRAVYSIDIHAKDMQNAIKYNVHDVAEDIDKIVIEEHKDGKTVHV